ncbi:Inner membrane permease YgbN [Planctomycetes bacterium Pan216]|uniref:Inner membrane permease YgbN n=1 Tax=Kolteria novifilia TaxID=2527975 RepID=A0A518B5H6_9BACT|nr:Inner membrane permease YgbN [Planctomycetes bacterium Pan216]
MPGFVIVLVGVIVVIAGVLALRLHAFLALILAALTVTLMTPGSAMETFAARKVAKGEWTESAAQSFVDETAGIRVAKAFGSACGRIGLIIALAAVIGRCLLDSGAADRIVRATLALFGETRAALAFLLSGFFLGIPVFFDTIFYLMLPLGTAMALRTRSHYVLYILTISAGASMAHSLVPPTPGPLFVATDLGIPVGTMMVGGLLVGLVTSTVGYLYAVWCDRAGPIPVPESHQRLESEGPDEEQLPSRPPSLALAVTPIVLPVLLIAGGTIVEAITGTPLRKMDPAWAQVLALVADRNVAMALAAAVSLGMLVLHGTEHRDDRRKAIQHALASGGVIILITSAGGAFGNALQLTGVGQEIKQWVLHYEFRGVWLLLLAFGVTALVRTAQGSATVAMVTAAGILGDLAAESSQLGIAPIYLALAIGCGSKPISWMNDSGFWIVGKMSGFSEWQTLRTFSATLTIMGFAGLLVLLLAASCFPMVESITMAPPVGSSR